MRDDPVSSARNQPTIIVYREHLGPFSETFIAAQAAHLTRFRPVFAGGRRVAAANSAYRDAIVANRGGVIGRLRELAQMRFGWSPQVISEVRRLNPHAMHAHFGPDGATALALARQLKIPLLVTFHGFDASMRDEYASRSHYSHRLYLKRRSRLQREATRFIAVSEHIRREMLRQGYPAEKIVVHHIGVDTDYFSEDPTIARENVVLFVGRLVEKKGCEFLISAMSRVQERHPDTELVIIGDGVRRADLERQAASSLRRYRFLGVQSPEQVKDWMNRARIFALPSVTAESGDTEGLPISLLEAQSMGLPAVTFDSGGNAEAVAHEVTGFVSPERDVDGLARGILTLLDNPEVWERMHRHGPERVRAHFDLRRQTGKLEDVYAELR